jgi:pimeloyl-ACP methyl ester carboxylesterase
MPEPDLHYSTSGSGPPLIVMHGLFGSSRNWHSQVRRFAPSYQVFAIDLRNHGQSFHSDEMNYTAMAGDVARLLDSLGLSGCRVLGHSMGGKVAMTLAILYPGLVSRMVVADIAPLAYYHHYDDLIEPILALELGSFETRTQVDHALRPHIPEDQLRAFLLQNLVRDATGWRWRINWRVIQRDMEALTGFAELPRDWFGNLPTLFIRGANSDYIDAAGVEVIERHFENAGVATIAAAGHWLHAEKPEEFSQLVLDFMRQD